MLGWKCLKLVAFVVSENVGLPSVGIAPQSGEHCVTQPVRGDITKGVLKSTFQQGNIRSSKLLRILTVNR